MFAKHGRVGGSNICPETKVEVRLSNLKMIFAEGRKYTLYFSEHLICALNSLRYGACWSSILTN